MEHRINHAIGIIPTRYASIRLPGKPLADICGKPLLQRVWEGACQSMTLDRIVIATDDERIAKLCSEIGAEFIMTPSRLGSGSDRVYFAYNALGESAQIIVNIQGDEPMITGAVIDKLVNEFAKSYADVATLVKKIENEEDLDNPSIVKVVTRKDNTAMYFSRNVIPFIRDEAKKERLKKMIYWKHIGIYAYTADSLKQFIELPPAKSELAEKLEQLRLLEAGATYLCVETDAELHGVDTPQDLEIVRKIIEGKSV